jgi:hypothetical protein
MYSKEKNVRESAKTHGREVVKDFSEQGAKALQHQAGRGSKRRQGQHLRYVNAWVSVCVFSENRQKIIKK